jgi:hypothetical protein
MSRSRRVLVTGLAALAAVAVAAPSAAAQPPPSASCLGVLSSFAGQAGIRSDFAPAPGSEVSRIAHEHGDFGFCLIVFGGG